MRYADLYNRSISEPEQFWAEQAQRIHWYKFPEKILSKDAHGLYRWYKGGQLNTSYLALDYHVEHGRGDQAALIYDSPVTQSFQRYTYRELRDAVAKFAGALRDLGVEKGDRVIIYMPMTPQVVIAMLACARLGDPLGGIWRVCPPRTGLADRRCQTQSDAHGQRRGRI